MSYLSYQQEKEQKRNTIRNTIRNALTLKNTNNQINQQKIKNKQTYKISQKQQQSKQQQLSFFKTLKSIIKQQMYSLKAIINWKQFLFYNVYPFQLDSSINQKQKLGIKYLIYMQLFVIFNSSLSAIYFIFLKKGSKLKNVIFGVCIAGYISCAAFYWQNLIIRQKIQGLSSKYGKKNNYYDFERNNQACNWIRNQYIKQYPQYYLKKKTLIDRQNQRFKFYYSNQLQLL